MNKKYIIPFLFVGFIGLVNSASAAIFVSCKKSTYSGNIHDDDNIAKPTSIRAFNVPLSSKQGKEGTSEWTSTYNYKGLGLTIAVQLTAFGYETLSNFDGGSLQKTSKTGYYFQRFQGETAPILINTHYDYRQSFKLLCSLYFPAIDQDEAPVTENPPAEEDAG